MGYEFVSKRIRFFLSHLSISLFSGIFLWYLVFFVWYPLPLAKALGVSELVLLVLLIDVIIGPILGLAVYKEHKKSLKYDLSIIVFIQIFAFSYGLNTLFQGRPSWIVFDYSAFHIVKYSDVEKESLNTATEDQKPLWFATKFVSLDAPNSNSLIRNHGNQFIIYSPWYYQALDQKQDRLKSAALPLSLLNNYNEADKVKEILNENHNADSWIALSAPVTDMVILLNKEQAEIVRIVDLRPWN